jgi:dihydrolipoamide dehydrogenase
VRSADVVVLGAGSAGVAVAQRLGEGGCDVTLVADGLIGGECPYVACMPSKALLRSAGTRSEMRHAQDLGASAIPVDLGPRGAAWALAVARRDAIAEHRSDADAAQQLKRAGVDVLRGRGRVNRPGVVVVDDDEEIACRDLVVATGSVASRPPIPGLDRAPTWTSDEALSSPLLPARLVVLGGGPVGCELAQVYARFGCRVTIVEPADRLLPGSHAEAGRIVGAALAEDGVQVVVGSGADRVDVSGPGADVVLEDGQHLRADRILLATGRAPAVRGLGLDTLGIDVEDAIEIDDHCRVKDHPHVWAAGDVTGLAPYTHTADHHGEVIAANLLGGDRTAVSADRIAGCCFTDPAVAQVGRTEGDGLRTKTVDHGETAKASAEGDVHPGSTTLAVDEHGRVAGACIVGPAAPETILAVATAMTAALPVGDFARTIAPFPTWGEALATAAKDLAGASSSC